MRKFSLKPEPDPAPPGSAVVTLAEVHDHPPEPAAPVVTNEPVGVLTTLKSFRPSAGTATHSAGLGRHADTMVEHVRDRVSEAVHMLQQIAVDAACANDLDGVDLLNNLMTKLK
jgi:hypothetical protein